MSWCSGPPQGQGQCYPPKSSLTLLPHTDPPPTRPLPLLPLPVTPNLAHVMSQVALHPSGSVRPRGYPLRSDSLRLFLQRPSHWSPASAFTLPTHALQGCQNNLSDKPGHVTSLLETFHGSLTPFRQNPDFSVRPTRRCVGSC